MLSSHAISERATEHRSKHQGHGCYFCGGGSQHSFERAPQRHLAGAGRPV
jgi:YHS domain-containing protein